MLAVVVAEAGAALEVLPHLEVRGELLAVAVLVGVEPDGPQRLLLAAGLVHLGHRRGREEHLVRGDVGGGHLVRVRVRVSEGQG